MVSTSERIVKMETQIENLDKKISDHNVSNEKGFDSIILAIKTLRQDINETYATKEEVRPLRLAVYTSIVIFVTALVGFGFWLLQKAIESGVLS